MTLAHRQPMTKTQERETAQARLQAALDVLCEIDGIDAIPGHLRLAHTRLLERNRAASQDQGWCA